MEHWTDSLTHQDLQTPENKAILGKFNSADDAHVGYIQLQKAAGKPYKLPDSMDKLPDDATRADLTGRMGKLMGAVENEEAMADVNFADGLPDANMVNVDLVTAFKAFAIENKLPKSTVAAMVKFSNQFSLKARQTQTEGLTANTTKVNGELGPLFGGAEGLKTNNEKVRQMFSAHAGLTAEEFKVLEPDFKDDGMRTSTPLWKGLYNLADKFGEGTTEPALGAGGNKDEIGIKQELPVTAGILGW